MVVEIKFVRLESRVPGLESDGVPSNGVIEVAAPHEHGELVKGEMDSVLPLYQLSHPSEFPSTDVYLTERAASMVLISCLTLSTNGAGLSSSPWRRLPRFILILLLRTVGGVQTGIW